MPCHFLATVPRRCLLGALLCFALFIGQGCTLVPAAATAPECPACDDPSVLAPSLDCVATDPDGRTFAVWGYSNSATKNVFVPIGTTNRMFPGPTSLGQPVIFYPGKTSGAFATAIPTSLEGMRWVLGSGVAVAKTAGSSTCEVVEGAEGYEAIVAGWTPPAVHVPLTTDLNKVLADTVVDTEASTPGDPNSEIPPTAPGYTPGNFAVSNDGTATYSLPLNVPPGRMGVQPTLALSYNSRAGNGIVGVGWKLQGFSRVERCKKTFASPNGLTNSPDGELAPITFASDHRLCLDGDYLIRVSTPETPNTREYRPEHDPTTRVIAEGPDVGALGPPSFTVYEKSGRIRRYGTSENSRLEGFIVGVTADPLKLDKPIDTHVESVGERARLAWEIAEIADRSGNAMYFEYEVQSRCLKAPPSPCHTLQLRPKDIRYTYGTEDPKTRRLVRFSYTDSRPDPQTGFVSGYETAANVLLAQIDMWGPNPMDQGHLRTYKLTYNWQAKSLSSESFPDALIDLPQTTTSGRSLLQRVQECDAGGVCKAPTRFEWERGLQLFEDIDTTIGRNGADDVGWGGSPRDGGAGGSGSQHWAILIADIDGDGRDDLLYRKSKRMALHGCPEAPAEEHCDDQVHWYYRLSIDRPDGGRGFEAEEHLAGLPIQHGENNRTIPMPRAMDIDGDGQVEILFPAQGLLQGPPEVAGSVTIAPQWQNWRFSPGLGIFQPVAIDEPAETTGTPLLTGCTYCSIWPAQLYIADLLGDGLPEFIRPYLLPLPGSPEAVRAREPGWAYRANRPSGLAPAYAFFEGTPPISTPPPTGWTFYARQFGAAYAADIDGSGKTPLLVRNRVAAACGSVLCATDGVRLEALSLDGPAASPAHRSTTLPIIERENLLHSWHYIFLDINGDGLQDALLIPDSGDIYYGGGVKPTISINTGNGFRAFTDAVGPVPDSLAFNATNEESVDAGMRVMDHNDDGLPDVVLFGNRGGRDPVGSESVIELPRFGIMVYQSNGSGLTPTFPLSRSPKRPGIYRSIPARASSGTRLPWVEHRGYPLSQVLDVNGDGLADLITWDPTTGSLHLYRREGKRPDVLTAVHNGLGHQINIRYSPYVQGSSSEPGCTYPLRCLTRGLWVVSEYDIATGPGSFRNFALEYSGATFDRLGRGWLGFSYRGEFDSRTRTRRSTYFERKTERVGSAYPFAMRPTLESRVTYTDDSIRRSYVRSVPDFQINGDLKKSQPFAVHEQTVTKSVTENLEPIFSLRQQFVYDPFNDSLRHRESTVEGTDIKSIEDIEYVDVPEKWLLALPKKITHTSISKGVSGVETETRTTSFDHDLSSGLLARRTIEPDAGADLRLESKLVRNPSGQVIGAIHRDLTGLQRETWTAYAHADGVFPSSVTNTLGHITRYDFHGGLGVLGRVRDENGVPMTLQYDRFGRLLRVKQKDSAALTLRYIKDGIGTYSVVAAEEGAGEMIIRFDQLDRPSSEIVKGFDGSRVHLDIDYDRAFPNRVAFVTGPWIDGDVTAALTAFDSDNLGRTLTTRRPDGASASYAYGSTTTTLHDEDGRTNGFELDVLGRVVASFVQGVESTDKREPHETRTRYSYGPFGTLRQIIDPKGNATIAEYDRLGRRVRLLDPDSGVTRSTYNAFGELTSETNADEVATMYFRDVGGRVTATSNAVDGTTCWLFDAEPFALGNLVKSISPDGVTNHYVFNSLSRLTSRSTNVAGTDYNFSFTYDAQGRLQRTHYPSIKDPKTGALRRFILTRRYSPQNGELAAVVAEADPAKAPSDKDFTFWQAVRQTARGYIEEERFGNEAVSGTRAYDPQRAFLIGLTFTRPLAVSSGLSPLIENYGFTYKPSGLLETQSDSTAGVTQSFEHDATGQLNHWNGTSKKEGAFTGQYAYDDLGNLRDFELSTAPEKDVHYGIDGTYGPHGVSSSVDSSASAIKHVYDKAGNQTSSGTRSVRFRAFGLAESITVGKETYRFRYDASRKRVVKELPGGGSTTYIAGLYERRASPTGVTHVMYVPSVEGPVAQVQWVESGDGLTESVRYLLADRLGSVGTVTDEKGLVLAEQRYEPFGQRVDAYDPTTAGAAPADVTLGYGSHEAEDSLGLINMGGRHYDPSLRRFITPDPLGGSLRGSHATNRFSYVVNSPLALTDPSGFEPSQTGTFWDPHPVYIEGTRPAEPPLPDSDDDAMAKRWTPKTWTVEGFRPSPSDSGEKTLRGLVSQLKNQAAEKPATGSADDSGDAANSPSSYNYYYLEAQGDPWGISNDLSQLSGVAEAYGAGDAEAFCSVCTNDPLDIFLGPSGAVAYANFQDAYGSAQTKLMLDISDATMTVIGGMEAGMAKAAMMAPPPIGGGGPYGGVGAAVSKPAGGPFRALARVFGRSRHHMPAYDALKKSGVETVFSYRNAPAISIETVDHWKTASYGWPFSKAGTYRAMQTQWLREGRFLDVLAADIMDIRRVEQAIGQPGKYDRAVQEMLDYLWSGNW